MAQPFFLAYQGRNDRDLQSRFGDARFAGSWPSVTAR